MPSQNPYGVPLPITVLWEAIADRYGDSAVVELQTLYAVANRRYGRVSKLNTMRRLVGHYERRGRHPRLAEWKATLADPMTFIDREDQPESPH